MLATTPTSKVVGRATPCAPWLIIAITLINFAASAQTTNLLAAVQSTNAPVAPLELPPLPSAGPSIIRVIGALALVLGIFFGGVWLFRNWQRLTIQRGRAPKLNVLETRPLGGKHALYVIGYEQERFLLSASPTGVTLITHLPTAAENASADSTTTTQAPPSFAQALTQVLKGK
ncbi:MAG TPA: flagellar biosynthetic protein FliO [Verrucomicrobiae bacterium]|nr:flagellar biosynthetic protein FliO [Verrucomicrobiae bacterium]